MRCIHLSIAVIAMLLVIGYSHAEPTLNGLRVYPDGSNAAEGGDEVPLNPKPPMSNLDPPSQINGEKPILNQLADNLRQESHSIDKGMQGIELNKHKPHSHLEEKNKSSDVENVKSHDPEQFEELIIKISKFLDDYFAEKQCMDAQEKCKKVLSLSNTKCSKPMRTGKICRPKSNVENSQSLLNTRPPTRNHLASRSVPPPKIPIHVRKPNYNRREFAEAGSGSDEAGSGSAEAGSGSDSEANNELENDNGNRKFNYSRFRRNSQVVSKPIHPRFRRSPKVVTTIVSDKVVKVSTHR